MSSQNADIHAYVVNRAREARLAQMAEAQRLAEKRNADRAARQAAR
ncbi:hypothetical protein [Micromonospora sp. NPDC050695]